jgi:hypothetical protein
MMRETEVQIGNPEKGDISNGVRKGTFLTSFDTQGHPGLTREDGRFIVLRKSKGEMQNSA